MKKTSPLLLVLSLIFAACSEAPPPTPLKVVRTLIVGTDETTDEAPAQQEGGGQNPARFAVDALQGGRARNALLAVADGDTVVSRAYSGDVRARFETTLGFRIPGKVIARLVDAGAVVKAGQPLARLDAADAMLQTSQARALAALALADTKRYRELRAKNFVSQAALDARETALTAAQAQAGLAQNQAAYTTLVADRAGIIAAALAEPGQVVAVGQPVFRLAPDGEREVAISLPETEVAHFTVGMPAEVSLWAQGRGAPSLAGKIREITPVADPATRTYAVRVALPGADARLPLGLTATVRFPHGKTATGKTIRLPLSALFQQGEQMAVWIVGADNTVSLKPVTVAALGDEGAQITAGLAGGERVVAAGVHKLVAGEKVRLAEPAK